MARTFATFVSAMPFFRPRLPSLLCALGCRVGFSAVLAGAAEPPQQLPAVRVSDRASVNDAPQLPQVLESVGALTIAETLHVFDSEDTVKYLPSLFVRKRMPGDSQATLGSRVWGVSSSARSLVFADGVLLSALIANNNSIGGPRWGLVAPAEIERVDVMYGPFAAEYAGNSMGAVLAITTRQPEKLEAAVESSLAWQSFQQYGTHDTFPTRQAAASAGNRAGPFSFWLTANLQDAYSQPLNYVTMSVVPAGLTGAFAAANKFGQPAPVAGASGLQHTRGLTGRAKVAYDFTPQVRATYSYSRWDNRGEAEAQTYLHDAAGLPTFAGLAGFASGTYHLRQQHSAHHLALRTDTRGPIDFEAAAMLFRMERDDQRLPTTASATGTTFGPAGRIASLSGTGWSTIDVKATWRPDPARPNTAGHQVTFGVHQDRYRLLNPTHATADWRNATAPTGLVSEGDGRTRTSALWAQDTWRLTPTVRATVGARYERWRGFDGLNVNGNTVVRPPAVAAEGASPKASVTWAPARGWRLTGSVAQACRFATAAELYQLVSTGTTFTAPSPDLKPDRVLAREIRLEHDHDGGRVRLSLFQDDIHDAIITQFNPLVAGSSQLFSFPSNVDHVRARGAELALQHTFRNVIELSGSATWVDARTLATRGQGQFGSAVGKQLPNIPEWRATLASTWRPRAGWALTLAGRYSGMSTTTLDAADTNANTWQGFGAWFVADAHLSYRIDGHWLASAGVDNALNRKYFVFHPFPQRTWTTQLKYGF
jgi:iron complex outermembrane recepter protein